MRTLSPLPPDVAKVAFRMADFEVDVKLSSAVIGRMCSKMAVRKSCLPNMYIHGFSNDAIYRK